MNFEYWLYVICELDENDELGAFAKIGITTDVERRRKELATASARTLDVLATAALGYISTHQARRLEKAVHARFSHLRRRGEWFVFTDEIYAWWCEIEANPEGVYSLLRRYDECRPGDPLFSPTRSVT